MFIDIQLGHFGPLDIAALAFLLVGWSVMGFVIERPGAARPSVTVLMNGYRREWLRHFVTREPRIFDATIIGNLRQGTTFLASACMITIGGGLALVGNTERLTGLAEDLVQTSAPAIVWEVKILLVLLFLANAFLKFLWAHRLFGYCSILMAAVPNETDDPTAYHRSAQAAEINISAAKSYNRGLRSIYFALGAIAWLAGPLPLMLATLSTLYVLWRREFGSVSRRVLSESTPK